MDSSQFRHTGITIGGNMAFPPASGENCDPPTWITGSYIGPLDLVSGAIVAYGQRALSTARLGSTYADIQRTSDAATQSFNFDAVTGAVPTADIETFVGSDTFQQTGAVSDGSQSIVLDDATGVTIGQQVSGANVLADTLVIDVSGDTILISEPATGDDPAQVLTFTQVGLVTTWRDQSGNGAHVSATTATFVPNQQNNRSGIRGPSVDAFTAATFSAPCNGGAYTVFAAAPAGWAIEVDDGSSAGYVIAEGTSGGASSLCKCDAGDNDHNEAGGDQHLTQDDTIHLYEYVWEFGSKQFLLDGQSQGFDTDNDFGGPLGNFTIDTVGRLVISSVGAGDVAKAGFEIIMWPSLLSSADRAAIRQNMADYYGITIT